MRALAAAVALATAAAAAWAQQDPAGDRPSLGLPLECIPGETCWVVNHVDEDAGPGARDYTCGPQTYNGHDGTDLAIRNLRAMRKGVPVLASAPGTVRALRDGAPDGELLARGSAAVAGHECGNGVLITHDGGWQTQYCHLRRGSVAVRKGERVDRGTPLGRVGMSGRAEFPHVHLTVRHGGVAIDPFTGHAAGSGCAGAAEPLWQAAASQALRYRPVSIYDAGIAGEMPSMAQVLRGDGIAPPRRDSRVLAAWTALYGMRAGDELVLELAGPEGRTLAQNRHRVERTQARRISILGKRRGAAAWPAGRYRLIVRVMRGGGTTPAAERVLEVEID